MPWIEYHDVLRDLAKVHRLAFVLKVSYPTALGHLSCLWCWAVQNARDGNLKKFSPEEIAYGGRWDGDPVKFRKALVECRWLDRDGKLHDWDKYGLRMLNSARDRMAKHRQESLQNSYVTHSRKEGKKGRKVKDGGAGEGANGLPSAWDAWQEVRDKLNGWSPGQPAPTFSHPVVAKVAKLIGHNTIREGKNEVANRAHFVKAYEAEVAKG